MKTSKMARIWLQAVAVPAADESFWLRAAGWECDLSKRLGREWWSCFLEPGKSSHIAITPFVFTF